MNIETMTTDDILEHLHKRARGGQEVNLLEELTKRKLDESEKPWVELESAVVFRKIPADVVPRGDGRGAGDSVYVLALKEEDLQLDFDIGFKRSRGGWHWEYSDTEGIVPEFYLDFGSKE